jgi:hypothetical protein
VDFLRRHLTYANVAATLALFLALGGAAYAATQLPKNSVGTKQLRNGAVTAAKINKKTRRQLQGSRGPAGPQGPQGKTGRQGPKGAAGAKGAQGPTGKTGEDGTGPAYEVFGAMRPIEASATTVLSQTLSGGQYVLSVDVAVESSVPTAVTCVLSEGGGAEGVAFVEPGKPASLSLSVLRSVGSSGTVSKLICSAPGGATARYANVIATQVKSVSRAGG